MQVRGENGSFITLPFFFFSEDNHYTAAFERKKTQKRKTNGKNEAAAGAHLPFSIVCST